ncbi:TPA: ABC transporter ATP-binding protein [Candidatus Poribacteria bacterium]|nr:ABC transporter ATP-binding protein [Candidatus Poribacteria bacterium]
MLELINISKYYEIPENNKPNYVLKDISLNVSNGESIAIVGPSGSGKSTLLNIIGALDRPSDGKVILDGKDFSLMDEKQLALIRNQEIGFIFQLHHLLPQCTVLENVLIPTLAFKDSKKSNPSEYARRLLDRVGLKDRLFYRPGQLSGGERQRVAVVRALINHPKLLLADEPTGSLDHQNALSLVQLLAEINKDESVTLIMVTHSLELASKMSTILELREGKLIKK